MFGGCHMYLHTSSYKSIYNDDSSENVPYSNATRHRIVFNYARLQSKVLISIIIISIFLSATVLVTIHANSQYSAEASVHERTIIVASGDTLWSIAREYGPTNSDIRKVVLKIKNRNLMTASNIFVGQQLIIPQFEK